MFGHSGYGTGKQVIENYQVQVKLPSLKTDSRTNITTPDCYPVYMANNGETLSVSVAFNDGIKVKV